MTILSKESLLSKSPVQFDVYEIEAGQIRVRSITRSEEAKLTAWTKPNGKPSQRRQDLRSLKLVTMCLVDAEGAYLFPFPDTKDGNAAFFEFAKSIENDSADKWSEIEVAVMKHCGYLKEVPEGELLGK